MNHIYINMKNDTLTLHKELHSFDTPMNGSYLIKRENVLFGLTYVIHVCT